MNLSEVEELLRGVTPGPWKANYPKWEPSNFIVQTDHPCRRVLAKFDGDGDGPDAQSLADARFIAWCREGVPALIALATAQAAQIAGLEATIRKFQTVADDWECPLGVKGCAENCGNYGCGN